MTLTELCELYAETLDDYKEDEWYTTRRGFWTGQYPKFVAWVLANGYSIAPTLHYEI